MLWRRLLLWRPRCGGHTVAGTAVAGLGLRVVVITSGHSTQSRHRRSQRHQRHLCVFSCGGFSCGVVRSGPQADRANRLWRHAHQSQQGVCQCERLPGKVEQVVPPLMRPFEPRIRGVGGGWTVRQAHPTGARLVLSAHQSLHPGRHTNRSHHRVLCTVVRYPQRRTCPTRSALHSLINVFADRHPAFLPIDARPPHDHHPVSGEEPRMRGRPGCMRACPPCRQRRQLRCLRESSLRQW